MDTVISLFIYIYHTDSFTVKFAFVKVYYVQLIQKVLKPFTMEVKITKVFHDAKKMQRHYKVYFQKKIRLIDCLVH